MEEAKTEKDQKKGQNKGKKKGLRKPGIFKKIRPAVVFLLIFLVMTGAVYVLAGGKAAAAMFIAALIYCAFVFFAVMLSGRKLTAKIKADPSVDKNVRVNASVEAENGSIVPVPSCTMDLTCENILTKEQEKITLDHSFRPKGKNENSFRVTSSRCGRINIRMEDALISDPTGLFSRKQDIHAESSIYIMPEIKGIDIPSDYLDSYDMESYTYSQHRKGNDTGEVFGIREYSDGDSPKQIHWKLSAKMDDLMVKIPSYPIENKLVVLLDNSIPENAVLGPEKRSDLMEYFFSISHSLLEKNITHSLGWCDHKTGGFVLKRIENDGDMWAAVPEALSAGIEQSKLTTAYRFLASLGEEHFTNHFIVTALDAKETDRLAEYGQVRVFRK